MPTKSCTQSERRKQLGEIQRYWLARHREYPTQFAAGVVYGLRCAERPELHLDFLKMVRESRSHAQRNAAVRRKKEAR